MYIGLDIGGTKIEGRIFNLLGEKGENSYDFIFDSKKYFLEEKFKLRVPTLRDEGIGPVLKRLYVLVQDLMDSQNLSIEDLLGIGIGMPGSVHPKKQIQLNGNSGIFSGVPLREKIAYELKLSCPIILANDANCFSLAESLLGVGRNNLGNASAIGIILGTGF